MTRTELKMALKLHHDWKINYRRDYALLLLLYPEGKILSMFEAVISGQINFLHKHSIYDFEIDWQGVYRQAAHEMHLLVEEDYNAKI